jgi:hypothetical protein
MRTDKDKRTDENRNRMRKNKDESGIRKRHEKGNAMA